jgi:signal transduction histidine kinase
MVLTSRFVIQTTTKWRIAARHHPGPEAVALTWFAVVGLVVAVAAALLTGALARRAGSMEASRSFEQIAVVVAGSVVAPQLTQDLVDGEPASTAALEDAVAALRTAGPVVGITVRDSRGRVVWSDQEGPAANAAPLRPDQRTALQTGSVAPVPVDPGTSGADVLTASVGVRDSDGDRLLVEVVGRRGDLGTSVRIAWTHFAPALLGTLLVLELLQLPLVWQLAHRTRRHREAAAALREAAVVATEVERHRIARHLHDDVLPGLHGLTYFLDATRRGSPGSEPSAAVLDRTAESLRGSIRELRAVLHGLSQARMPEAGLAQGLADLAVRLEVTGVSVTLRVRDLEGLPREVAEVLYRCAQETLRNVAAHSGAQHVELSVSIEASHVTMTVDDDGRGFEETRLTESRATGHVGLRALGDLVADSGGSLTASSSPGLGTRVVVRVPLDNVGVDMRVLR